MTNIRKTLIALCAATASMGAFAQAAEEHQAHHPAGAASAAGPVKKAPGKAMRADKMAAMDQHMKSMQAMHEKMMSAQTPEARQALMAEHMKTMQEGMTMMKQMGGNGMKGDMASRQQMMEKRMDMMESMMQMMMDRMPPAPAN
ncbi:MAG: hypothetical protein A3G29_08950 [Burkholderiales bacterium RIFCSPLOWO2_12_FULL_64_99]|jgi:uncharacterized protein YicC (UPF0701 family)|uniref:hypothetical protein n=1 Tax=Aquabacterium sp. TaxID=1872578 RepID=UPI0008BEF9A9|nr:hypothetical protein [Aquabacterium sp.]OGB03454.1 MAG: hypothetical protein A3E52_15880 [Burkholderiales bacterium RIFCSPHIGHO2_12_FULL_63_20]OGB65260.1 MAG: hypothetical protein A3G29_08950 [Burkholderiales bacterium RIFCSPLOWO2_12_FULL_64_99]